MMNKILLIICFLSVTGICEIVYAQQSGEPESIVIRNLRMIDRSGETEDHQVNIHIKDTKLFIVTNDDIELKEGMVVFDAAGTVLMGVLDIGQAANFLLVDQDPQENIEVLLDTKAHIVFAVKEGRVLVNKLDKPPPVQSTPESKKPAKWMAYTPPPMALPLNYQDKTRWNRWNTKPVNGIFLAAMALDRSRWLWQDDQSHEQVGELKEYSGGEIRAFRLGVAGTLNFKRPWFYTVVAATHAFDKGYNDTVYNQLTMLDYRIDIPVFKTINISIGKQKEPISMERLGLGTQIPMQERPTALDAFFSVRNVGISFNGLALQKRMSWAIGIYNDWFDASQKFSESATQVAGRATGLAYISEDETHLLHLGAGIRYSDGKEIFRYGSNPEFNQAPVFLETGEMEANRSTTLDLEVSWRRGPVWLSGEWVRNSLSSSQLEEPVFGGYFIAGTWILTREMRPYIRRNGTIGPVPVSRSVQQGGPGAWELAGRFSSLDLNGGIIDGGKISIASLGINWWLTSNFGLNMNYRYIVLDQEGILGGSQGFMLRLILMLE